MAFLVFGAGAVVAAALAKILGKRNPAQPLTPSIDFCDDERKDKRVLKYGCNPHQKPANILSQRGENTPLTDDTERSDGRREISILCTEWKSWVHKSFGCAQCLATCDRAAPFAGVRGHLASFVLTQFSAPQFARSCFIQTCVTSWSSSVCSLVCDAQRGLWSW